MLRGEPHAVKSRDRFFWAHFTDQPRPGGLGALRVLAKGSLHGWSPGRPAPTSTTIARSSSA